MEHFLREYTTRSILSYLNTYNTNHMLYNYQNTNSNNNNDSINSNNNNNFYFIAPQQPLLDNDISSNDSEQYDSIYSSVTTTSTSSISSPSYHISSNHNSAATAERLLLPSLAAAAMDATTVSVSSTVAATAADINTTLLSSVTENYTNFLMQNSTCDSLTSADDDDGSALSSVYFKTIVYLMYIPIFVFALLGNGTVCYIVKSTPRMRTVTNFFIANLAVGDILMSLFCVPFSFVSIFILHHWPFGTVLCYLVNYSQAVSVLVSAYTLVAISIDRYIAIMWPLRPRITKRYAKIIIAGVWGIALATALPILIVSKLTQPEDWFVECHRYICREEWPSNEQNYYYTLALFTLQFIVPLAVLIFTYTRIALAVWGKRPPGEAENSRDQRMARSKRKMIKMMVMVVIVFTICWLPFNVLVFLLNYETILMWEPLPYFWFAFHWLAMSHSCYNPIIYCYMNARFRGGFLQIIYHVPGLRRCCCLRRYLHNRGDRSYEATGTDDAFHLQRVNTSTTYISTRRKLRANSMQMSQFSCAEATVFR